MPPSPGLRGTYRTDLPARAAYAEGAGIYRIVPSAVAIPADTADLVRLVRWAGAHGLALIPRGAGSGMAGGNVGDGVIVDLNRIGGRAVAIQAERRRAVAAASVTHLELNRATGAHGLRLPPDPSSGRFATLGGMLSTNAAGARTVRYGSVRRWVASASSRATIALKRRASWRIGYGPPVGSRTRIARSPASTRSAASAMASSPPAARRIARPTATIPTAAMIRTARPPTRAASPSGPAAATALATRPRSPTSPNRNRTPNRQPKPRAIREGRRPQGP